MAAPVDLIPSASEGTQTTSEQATSENARRRDLARAKARATALLVVMAGAYVALVTFTDDHGSVGYARAAVEAGLVGGLADWFAVTALFRHPLGIPVPHTAIIRTRKEQFGETLGEFVQENFLSPDVLRARVSSADPIGRMTSWAADPRHARRAATVVSGVLVQMADLARDDDVHALLHGEIRTALDRIPFADLAGRGLQSMIAENRHRELVDATLVAIHRVLDEHRDVLHDRFVRSTPWWLPGPIESRLFERMLDGVTDLLDELNADPAHELRLRLDEGLHGLATRLQHDEGLRERVAQVRDELFANQELATWTASLWSDAKAALRRQADDPESRLHDRLADLVTAAGERVASDPALARTAADVLERGVTSLASRYRGEIAELVSGTISRWDGDETSDRLELLLGRDLQFIRINGTVVGALAGLFLHGVADVLG